MSLSKKIKYRKSDEVLIMNNLKNHFPDKYENAEFGEKPDIWVLDKSIGVEVTSGVFEEVYLSSRAFGKDIINSRKIMREKPISLREIEWVFDYPSCDLEEITGSKFIYKDKNKKIKIIENVEDLRINIKKHEIWEVDRSELNRLDDEYKSKVGPGVAFWEGEWNSLLIERIDEKIKKFNNYKKFRENNLAIFCFLNDKDDMINAKKYLSKYYEDKYMPFDYIFLCDPGDLIEVISFINKNSE